MQESSNIHCSGKRLLFARILAAARNDLLADVQEAEHKEHLVVPLPVDQGEHCNLPPAALQRGGTQSVSEFERIKSSATILFKRLRGGIKKKILVFFRKAPKGGGRGLAKSKIFLSEKTRPFQIAERGGGVSEFRSFSEKNQFFFLMPPLICTIFCTILQGREIYWGEFL